MGHPTFNKDLLPFDINLLRQALPNCLPSLKVQITLTIGGAILIEASPSVLGFDISPRMAVWIISGHPLKSTGQVSE